MTSVRSKVLLGAEPDQRFRVEAKAAIAMGGDAERQRDQFLGLFRERTGGHAGLRPLAEALHEDRQVATQNGKLA